MFKTSTAIIASMSLLSPTLIVAQETTPGQSTEQAQPDHPLVPPHKKGEVEKDAGAGKVAPKAEALTEPAQDEAQKEPEAMPPATAEEPAKAEEVKPAEAETPAQASPETAPTGATAKPKAPESAPTATEAEAPAPKPADAEAKAATAVEQAHEAEKTPAAKPTHVEAEAPATKPADAAEKGAKAEETAAEAGRTPAAKPETPKAVTAEDKPAPKAETPVANQAHEATTATPAATPEAAKPGAVTTTGAAPAEDDLRKALEAETGKAANPDPSKPEPSAAATTSATAPETAAPETAVATAAANAEAPKENDALKMLQDRIEGKAQDAAKDVQNVTDFAVTDQNARRSDEDFATSVAKSVDDKKDDNKGRDLARLALAGMAGFAVGKMLSNNQQVALNTGDRVVVTNPDGSQQLIKDDDALLFQPGANVQTERFDDGSTITTVARGDGSRVVTIRDANLNILRRSVVYADGSSHLLIDDTTDVQPVQISTLPPPARPIDYSTQMSEQDLRNALMREAAIDRRFTLSQIRNIAQVRALVAPLDIQSITFDTGSAAITPDQARQLATLGQVIADSVKQNPKELYLIEGYTDAIGSDASNLALSDRRAESVALALTEYFQVPPENMIVQGYGEQFLKVQTQDAERANRRVAVRRITDLIEQR